MTGLETLGEPDPLRVETESGAVADMGHERIDDLGVVGLRTDVELVLRTHGIALELHEEYQSGKQRRSGECGQDAEDFFTHCFTKFLQRYKNFLLLCPGESHTTSSCRIPQARNRARVCGRSGAI